MNNAVDYAWRKKRRYVFNTLQEIVRGFKTTKVIKLLDVGCYDGSLTKEYQNIIEKLGYKSICVGVDINPTSLKFRNVIKADARNLPFKDEKFDIIISTEVIEHFVEGDMFLGECHRILRPNGFLILTTPNRLRFSSWPRNFKAFISKQKIVPGPNPEHLREYTPKELLKVVRDVGFSVIKFDFIAFNPYLGIPWKFYKILDMLTDKVFKSVTKWDMILVAQK